MDHTGLSESCFQILVWSLSESKMKLSDVRPTFRLQLIYPAWILLSRSLSILSTALDNDSR